MNGLDQDQQPLPEFVKDPVGVVQRRWRAMLLALAAGLLVTALFVWLHVPLFESEATVLVADQQISTEVVPTTVEQNPVDRVNMLLGEVFTPTNLLELIDRHRLYPRLQKSGDADELVSTMRERVSVESAEGFEMTRRNQAAVILSIRFEDEEAIRSAAVANDLASLFTNADLAIHSRQARLTTEFLKRELVKAERDLEQHTRALTRFRQEHRGELPSELSANQTRYDRLQERRAVLVNQVAESERRVRTLAAGVFPADDSPGAQMQRLRSQLTRQLAIHTEEHPSVQSLREEIAILEGELGVEPGGDAGQSLYEFSVREGRAQIAHLHGQIQEIDASLADLDGRIERTHQWAEDLAGMEQKAMVYTEAYDQLLRKVESAERAEDLYRAQQGAKVKVLDAARPPLEANSRRFQIALAGLIGSLAAGFAAGFLLEWRDPVISTPEGVENAAGVPVFGTIPRIG